MIPAVSSAIAASASISSPSRASHSVRSVAAPAVIAGAKAASREMCVAGATMRRRVRHVSPSLMMRPSPTSGSSALRCCELFGS